MMYSIVDHFVMGGEIRRVDDGAYVCSVVGSEGRREAEEGLIIMQAVGKQAGSELHW